MEVLIAVQQKHMKNKNEILFTAMCRKCHTDNEHRMSVLQKAHFIDLGINSLGNNTF